MSVAVSVAAGSRFWRRPWLEAAEVMSVRVSAPAMMPVSAMNAMSAVSKLCRCRFCLDATLFPCLTWSRHRGAPPRSAHVKRIC